MATSSWRRSPCDRAAAGTAARPASPTSSSWRIAACADGRVPAGRAQHGHAEAGRPLGGQGDVVEHRQGGEQAGVLEGLAHAGPGPGVVGPAGDVLAVEADPARGRAQAPGDQREQGRLAGAVGADDGVPGPGGDRQRDPVEGHQRPVAPAQPGRLQQRGHAAASGRRRSRGPGEPPREQVDGGHEHQAEHERARARRAGAERRRGPARPRPRPGPAPQRLPRPPMTTASRAMADTVAKPRSAGVTKRCLGDPERAGRPGGRAGDARTPRTWAGTCGSRATASAARCRGCRAGSGRRRCATPSTAPRADQDRAPARTSRGPRPAGRRPPGVQGDGRDAGQAVGPAGHALPARRPAAWTISPMARVSIRK